MILKCKILRLVNIPYCIKSDPIMWNHRDFWVKTPFLGGFTGLRRPVKYLKNDPFSGEIQNDDTSPTCQTMTLRGATRYLAQFHYFLSIKIVSVQKTLMVVKALWLALAKSRSRLSENWQNMGAPYIIFKNPLYVLYLSHFSFFDNCYFAKSVCPQMDDWRNLGIAARGKMAKSGWSPKSLHPSKKYFWKVPYDTVKQWPVNVCAGTYPRERIPNINLAPLAYTSNLTSKGQTHANYFLCNR